MIEIQGVWALYQSRLLARLGEYCDPRIFLKNL